MKKLPVTFFTLLLLAAATTMAQAAKPKLAVFVVGMDDWKRGDVVAHIVGEELNRDKSYQVVTRSGAVQVKLKSLRRASVSVNVCDLREWALSHGIFHVCLITSPDNQNFSAQLFDVCKLVVQQCSGSTLIEGFGAVDLKQLAWSLTSELRSCSLHPCNIPGMVFVEGGTFTMGCLASRDGSCKGNDVSMKEGVEVEDFWISDHEVTQGEWLAVMGSFPNNITGSNRNDDNPMIYVNMADAQRYLDSLNAKVANKCWTYKLPTEVQWEYAARGGKASKGYRYSGDNTIGNVAWYQGNRGSVHADFLAKVKIKKANELKIYDMTGNVAEWCDNGLSYANRGGGIYHNASECRIVSLAYQVTNSTRNNWQGFRVV
jgi:formylglycine-generating enzyme required for sulfatase activity